MTIRRLSVGAGFRYLLRSIAVGDGAEDVDRSDLVRYYAASGTPPGVFLGAGLAGLDHGAGVPVGQRVTAENLQRMLQSCADPITGETLGRAPGAASVGGFDLTFSPAKSVSVAWALADRATREVIERCHYAALAEVLAYAEREVLRSRSGTRGCIEEEIRGVVAASFTHFDSRSADPQLHDHVVVLNRVQSRRDGVWRTLDSRGLFAAAVTLSELHQGVLADLLSAELGWGWDAHRRRSSPVPKWEVAGVTTSLMDEFSTRTTAILAAKDRLIAQFEADHGRAPSDVEVLKLRQSATLATRRAKTGTSLAELSKRWSARATPYVDREPSAWVAELAGRALAPLTSGELDDAILLDVATTALEIVSARRPTFSRANVLAEVLRQLQGVRFAAPAERILTATRATELATAQALLLTTPDLHHTPHVLRRADGTSRFAATGHWLYTTTTLLDAEARLLDASGRTNAAVVSDAAAARAIALPVAGRTFALSADQARAVARITTSGRALDLLVGPAGTGKSTAMAALRAAWESEHGAHSVVALAPSAAAAQVLGEDMGVEADNLAKWLYEHRQHATRTRELAALRERVRARRGGAGPRLLARHEADLARWTLREGQLVVIDEASLAGTFALDEIIGAARDARAKVVLVGDDAQLSSVEAGGMFRTLVRQRGDDVATLVDVRRFTAVWEREASLGVRRGAAAALAAYANYERVTGGPREAMLDALYDAWRADVEGGRDAVMLAGDAATVAELNARARAERVARGVVSGEGVEVAGSFAGAGDVVVTRENDRRLRAGSGWVRNGDRWTVTGTQRDGSLRVTRVGGEGAVVLPAPYVREHIELAYATTVHRAQGRTVQCAHAFVSPTTTREVLYVALTRGSMANHLYVDTCYDPDPDTGHDELTAPRRALDVLGDVLGREGADESATDVIRRLQTRSIAELVAQYETIVALAQGPQWDDVLARSGFDDAELARLRSSPAYPALLTHLRDAQSRGFDPAVELPPLVTGRSFDDADDLAAVLTHRVARYVDAANLPDPPPGELVAGLFPRPTGVTDPDVLLALTDRATAIEQRAHLLATTAMERGDPWVSDFGDPPTSTERAEQWLGEVATSAAYRDRWGVNNSGHETDAPASLEQAVHRRRVLSAARRARAMAGADTAPRDTTYALSGERLPESPLLDYHRDL